MNIGIVGNTSLTEKLIKFLLGQRENIKYVFGLTDEEIEKKVNAADLKTLCLENDINYIQSNDWGLILDEEVDLVYEMGDSRFVPPVFVNRHYVIGNHGAILPYVQGGASLVWGRMLNSGEWGVSLMKLSDKIDEGDILITKKVNYDPSSTSMQTFVEMCDDATISCVKTHYRQKTSSLLPNSGATIKVSKKQDPYKVIKVLKLCLDNEISVYLPPRSPEESTMKNEWSEEFSNIFKTANDFPYPKYIT